MRIQKLFKVNLIYDFSFISQGEDWHNMRTTVNPIMMQPKIVNSYVPLINDIVNEFLDNIPEIQGEDGEMPSNFVEYLNQWSLESITAISLEKRLGLMNLKNKNDFGKKIARTVRKIFELGMDFEMQPSIWRIYQTKKFKELIEAYNDLTKCDKVRIKTLLDVFQKSVKLKNSVEV